MPLKSGNHKSESNREEFRQYLEKSGVLDQLTTVLVQLYEEPEKPSSAVDFLKEHIGGNLSQSTDVETLRQEITQLKAKNKELEDEILQLKERVIQLQTESEI